MLRQLFTCTVCLHQTNKQQNTYLTYLYTICSSRKFIILQASHFSDGWPSQCNLVTFASDLHRPDLRGLKQFGEIFNFWVHHWILCFIPLHVIITGHYKLDRTNNYYFKIAAVVGLFVHFNMMSIAGLISGHNVGYMLAPPTSNVFLQ